MVKDAALEEALALVVGACTPLAGVEAPVRQAVGRTLVGDAVARWDLPPFDRALCAGYAVRAADLHRANLKRPARLEVVGAIPAGSVAGMSLAAGQAVRVDSGSPLPQGCDCVAPLGDSDGGLETVSVFCQLWPFDNVERQGSLVQAGSVLCRAGERPDCAQAALLRCAGVDRLSVRPGVQLGVLTVGDELVDSDCRVLPPAGVGDYDQLYLAENWGKWMDSAVCRRCGTPPEVVMEGCKEMLSMGVPLLLTAGGQEVVFSTLVQLGAEALFQGVRLRRCERAAALRYRGGLILVLPGEPFAAGVLAGLLVPTALAAFGDEPALLPRRRRVRLANAPELARPQRRLLPAALRGDAAVLLEGGETPLALVGMTGLVDLPGGSRPGAGEVVTAFAI